MLTPIRFKTLSLTTQTPINLMINPQENKLRFHLLKASDWRILACEIFATQTITLKISVKLSSDGNVFVLPTIIQIYRNILNLLLTNKFPITRPLPEYCTLMAVVRSILTDISTDQVQLELSNLGFEISLIKRFGTVYKAMPMCIASFISTFLPDK